MPISDPAGRCGAALALAAALVSACAPPPGGIEMRSVARGRALVMAAGRAIAIIPPEGYCILPDSARTGDAGAVVLIGACPGDAAADRPPALITALVSAEPLFRPGAPIEEELDRLEAFLSEETGRALIGRAGDPGPAPAVLETHREDDALILLVEDSGTPALPVASPRFWRAFLEIDGRMVSLTVNSLSRDRGEERAGLALMRALIAALRAGNRPPALRGAA
ncbi:MAG: hypothetical protein D6686_15280 [Alphaproteobacteria bacterium]|nr:MAG: hypothetical protein D6686_15280 [Alphaproteobacteria bacterium]